MVIRIKKWKYIDTIFRSNQFCIISLNNVTVLLKSVHAVRQCLDNGSFSKMTSFSLENEYLVLVLISSLEFNSSKNGHDPLLEQKLPHNEVKPKAYDAAQRLGNPCPFLMESNRTLSKIPRLHWTIPDASPELNQQLLYPNVRDPGLLNLCGLFWLLPTLDCLLRGGHTGYWTKWTD